jgi:predicted ATP-grasp superfamily ATP-dependent carboligase
MTELPAELDASSPASTTRTLDDQAYEFDVLVLDGATRQSLACVRSLGRAGLRVAVGETSDHIDSAHPALGLRSRYAARAVVLPSFTPDASAFAAAVTEFVRAHPTRVVLPTGDRVIGALLPVRDQFAAAGSTLALPPTPALDIANNKDRTIEIALGLGIRCPRSAHIDSLDKLPGLLAGFSFPFVLKPTASWAPLAPDRLQTIEVVSEAELTAVTREFLSAGVGVLAQEWVGGRREEIDLFMVGGEVRASFAWVMNRTFPTLGGVSSARASIALPPDTYAMAVDLVRAAGLDGMCDVEFRRDTRGRPYLMEINARLPGATEMSQLCGIDFPLLIWQWASGLAVDEIQGYRAGVRARWLRGELRWLWNNLHEGGRPDSVSRTRAVWTFLAEFARTRHYDCLDWRDLRPVIAEFRSTAVQSVTGRRPDF